MKKLKFDKEKLDFFEDKSSIWDYLKKGLWLLVASLGLSLLYYLIFALIFNTEEEKKMIIETRAIQEEYQDLEDKADRLEDVVSGLRDRDKQLYNTIFNSDPPDLYSTNSDSAYADESDQSEELGISARTKWRIARLLEYKNRCDGFISQINDTLTNGSERFTSIPSIIPLSNFSILQTGASAGYKVHPFYKKVVQHNGIDLVIPIGTEVLVSADGIVSSVSRSKKEKGNRIEVDHGNGYVTTYSHLGDIYVRKGMQIKQGAVIGRVGTSGTSFAPHLHYEVMLNGNYVDPIDYFFAQLSPSEYKEMALIAANTGQSLD